MKNDDKLDLDVRLLANSDRSFYYSQQSEEDGDEQAIKLLELGANPNVMNEEGLPVLYLAASGGRAELVAALISKGANISATTPLGRTALFATTERWAHGPDYVEAYARARAGVCKLLLQHGIDPKATDNDGKTALDYAQWEWNAQTYLVLSDGESLENWESKELSRRGLVWVQEFVDNLKAIMRPASQGNGYYYVDILVDDALEKFVEQCDSQCINYCFEDDLFEWFYRGQTLLHITAENGLTLSVQALLRRGADPAIKDYRGKTVFESQRNGTQELLQLVAIWRILQNDRLRRYCAYSYRVR